MTIPGLVDFEGVFPRVSAGVYIAPGARVIGDVELGEGASVWYNAVIRGDVFGITIGAGTNVQDGAVIHVTGGLHETEVGRDVTIGHGAILHGCAVGDRCLIGMGAIVLDGAEIGEESLVAAGAVIPPGMVVPAGSVVMGSPGKVRREVTDQERARFRASASHYQELARRHAGVATNGGGMHPDGGLAE